MRQTQEFSSSIVQNIDKDVIKDPPKPQIKSHIVFKGDLASQIIPPRRTKIFQSNKNKNILPVEFSNEMFAEHHRRLSTQNMISAQIGKNINVIFDAQLQQSPEQIFSLRKKATARDVVLFQPDHIESNFKNGIIRQDNLNFSKISQQTQKKAPYSSNIAISAGISNHIRSNTDYQHQQNSIKFNQSQIPKIQFNYGNQTQSAKKMETDRSKTIFIHEKAIQFEQNSKKLNRQRVNSNNFLIEKQRLYEGDNQDTLNNQTSFKNGYRSAPNDSIYNNLQNKETYFLNPDHHIIRESQQSNQENLQNLFKSSFQKQMDRPESQFLDGKQLKRHSEDSSLIYKVSDQLLEKEERKKTLIESSIQRQVPTGQNLSLFDKILSEGEEAFLKPKTSRRNSSFSPRKQQNISTIEQKSLFLPEMVLTPQILKIQSTASNFNQFLPNQVNNRKQIRINNISVNPSDSQKNKIIENYSQAYRISELQNYQQNNQLNRRADQLIRPEIIKLNHEPIVVDKKLTLQSQILDFSEQIKRKQTNRPRQNNDNQMHLIKNQKQINAIVQIKVKTKKQQSQEQSKKITDQNRQDQNIDRNLVQMMLSPMFINFNLDVLNLQQKKNLIAAGKQILSKNNQLQYEEKVSLMYSIELVTNKINPISKKQQILNDQQNRLISPLNPQMNDYVGNFINGLIPQQQQNTNSPFIINPHNIALNLINQTQPYYQMHQVKSEQSERKFRRINQVLFENIVKFIEKRNQSLSRQQQEKNNYDNRVKSDIISQGFRSKRKQQYGQKRKHMNSNFIIQGADLQYWDDYTQTKSPGLKKNKHNSKRPSRQIITEQQSQNEYQSFVHNNPIFFKNSKAQKDPIRLNSPTNIQSKDNTRFHSFLIDDTYSGENQGFDSEKLKLIHSRLNILSKQFHDQMQLIKSQIRQNHNQIKNLDNILLVKNNSKKRHLLDRIQQMKEKNMILKQKQNNMRIKNEQLFKMRQNISYSIDHHHDMNSFIEDFYEDRLDKIKQYNQMLYSRINKNQDISMFQTSYI